MAPMGTLYGSLPHQKHAGLDWYTWYWGRRNVPEITQLRAQVRNLSDLLQYG